MTETPQFREELQEELPLPLQGVKGYMFKFGKDKNAIFCVVCSQLQTPELTVRAVSASCLLFTLHICRLTETDTTPPPQSMVKGLQHLRLTLHLLLQTESSLTWALLLFCTYSTVYILLQHSWCGAPTILSHMYTDNKGLFYSIYKNIKSFLKKQY